MVPGAEGRAATGAEVDNIRNAIGQNNDYGKKFSEAQDATSSNFNKLKIFFRIRKKKFKKEF